MNKYQIPNYYRKADFFFPTNLKSYEGGRKLLLEENKNYEIDIIHNPNFGKDFKLTGDITYDKYVVEKEIANKKLEKINLKK